MANTATVTRKKSRPKSRTASKDAVSTSCLVRAAPASSMPVLGGSGSFWFVPRVLVLVADRVGEKEVVG